MTFPTLPENFELYWEIFLIWIGFGTVVGLGGKALMPGRDPGGSVATLLMGIFGTFIGCGVFSLIYKSPIRPTTDLSSFGLGTLGAFLILFFYRLLSGYWFVEGSDGPSSFRPRTHIRRRRRRRYAHIDFDD